MINKNFLIQLSSFANTIWPDMRVGHSVLAQEEENEHICTNPEGFVDNSECPEEDPYCNCPCKELIPKKETVFFDREETSQNKYKVISEDGSVVQEFQTKELAEDWIKFNGEMLPRPTEEEMEELNESVSECALIGTHLGEDWLGCDWKNPDSEISCVCPCINTKFKDYLEYNETYATYWNTPKHTPLYRNMLMRTILSKKVEILVPGDFLVRPGNIVEILEDISHFETKLVGRKHNGKWLVSSVNHMIIGASTHMMTLILIRDSNYIDPETDYFGDDE
jgi:hypothetical protein